MSLYPLQIDLLKYSKSLRIQTIGEKQVVYDICRRQFVHFTPEEFVRQLFIAYLIHDLDIGKGRISVEKQLMNYQSNRFDIGVRRADGAWSMLIECKSFKESLSNEVLLQIGKYNNTIEADFMIVTNGKKNYIWSKANLWSADSHLTDFAKLL